MTEVFIRFENLQSHQSTSFSLKPGMNFILSSGNNAGKSVIFKVLSTIARAPNNTNSKIASLVRYGATRGVARFTYENDIVVAVFINNPGEAAKLFFEHTHSDGSVTRSIECPQSLLTALGIHLMDGVVVNFNDADSVQLISTVSTEADAILNRILLDERIERMKSNLYELGRWVNSDLKIVSAKRSTTEEFLKDISYNNIVDEFAENAPVLEAACRIADTNFASVSHTKWTEEDIEDLQQLHRLCDVAQNIAGVVSTESTVDLDISKLSALGRIVAALSDAQGICPGTKAWIPEEKIDSLRQLVKFVSQFTLAYKAANEIDDSNRSLARISVELDQVQNILDANVQIVRCPVKGEVYYGPECLPRSTRSPLRGK